MILCIASFGEKVTDLAYLDLMPSVMAEFWRPHWVACYEFYIIPIEISP